MSIKDLLLLICSEEELLDVVTGTAQPAHSKVDDVLNTLTFFLQDALIFFKLQVPFRGISLEFSIFQQKYILC